MRKMGGGEDALARFLPMAVAALVKGRSVSPL